MGGIGWSSDSGWSATGPGVLNEQPMGGAIGAPVGGDPSTAIYGAIISGLANYAAQESANRTNRRIADQATTTNINEAEKNRVFQMMMSNSAFQRQIADLKQAGLNPLLAAGMSGASTPSGSTASAQTAHMENTLSGAITSAQNAVQMSMNNQKLGADIALTKDQQALTKAQTGKAAMETKVMSKGVPEADLKNKIYNWTNKFIERSQSNPQPIIKGFPNTKP